MMFRFAFLVLIIVTATFGAECRSLKKLALPQTEIQEAVTVPAGEYPADNELPAFCRVAGVIRPSSDSEIKFEVWMPSVNWNGKFHGFGLGGYAGSIVYPALAIGLRNGYAAAMTDTGHTSAINDASWALGHPEKLVDFAYRAVHEMTTKSKAIVRAFYGVAPRRSYFQGCSGGGRQALMEAQRFPEDYDGILAGAPSHDMILMYANRAKNAVAMRPDRGGYIPSAKLPAIQRAVVAACDAKDGVIDGVIENPPTCRPDLSVLACRGDESDNCLTAPQLDSLREVYDGLRDSRGKSLFPGVSPGGEAGSGWDRYVTGEKPETGSSHTLLNTFFRYLVHQNPNWDYRTFEVDKDVRVANERVGALLNATDTDLRRFAARGGKLILYHGWNDSGVPALSTVEYFRSMQEQMGEKATDSFVRLYMIPGMGHCGAGIGVDDIGTQVFPAADSKRHRDPRASVWAALDQWVETGLAPAEIVGRKHKDPRNPNNGIVRTRPICPYPQIAVYQGQGSTDEAANFRCAVELSPSQ